MAIKKDYTWRGVLVPQAYIRIDQISGGMRVPRGIPKPANEPPVTAAIWLATVGIYADATQYVPIMTLNLSAPITNPNESPFAALYAALRALPEFTGALDV